MGFSSRKGMNFSEEIAERRYGLDALIVYIHNLIDGDKETARRIRLEAAREMRNPERRKYFLKITRLAAKRAEDNIPRLSRIVHLLEDSLL